MTDTTKRTLNDHIGAALLELCQRILAERPDPALREWLAGWIERAIPDRLTVALDADTNRRGRIDTRSTRVTVYVRLEPDPDRGPIDMPLVTVRVRDLIDQHGHPIDARMTAKELLWQMGVGIPDTPAGLDDTSR